MIDRQCMFVRFYEFYLFDKNNIIYKWEFHYNDGDVEVLTKVKKCQ